MLIKVSLNIGFPTATIRDEIEINDEKLIGMNEKERDNYISEIVDNWANDYIQTSWKILE